MTNDSQGPQGRSFMGDALVISGISFYGYSLSLAFESGYNSYFNIPLYFVPFDLVAILSSIFATIGTLLFLSIFIRLAGWLGLMNPTNVAERIATFLIGATILITVILFLLAPPMTVWLLSYSGIALIAAMWLLLPLIGKPRDMLYKEKLLASVRENHEFSKRDPLLRLQDKIGPRHSAFIILAVMVLLIAAVSGYSNAKSKSIFETISTTPKMAILQFANGNFIASPYDNNTNELSNELFVISEQEASQHSYYLSTEKLGQLRPPETTRP